MLEIGIVAEGEALFAPPLGIEFNEVAGDILDMLLGALLEALPLASTKRRESRPLSPILRLVFRHLI